MADRDTPPDRSRASTTASSSTDPPRRHTPPTSASVAWVLADAILPKAPRHDRHTVYIQLGCRHYRRAIGASLQLAVRQDISISAGLAAMLCAWLDAYRGHHDHPRLRQLLTKVPQHSGHPTQPQVPPSAPPD